MGFVGEVGGVGRKPRSAPIFRFRDLNGERLLPRVLGRRFLGVWSWAASPWTKGRVDFQPEPGLAGIASLGAFTVSLVFLLLVTSEVTGPLQGVPVLSSLFFFFFEQNRQKQLHPHITHSPYNSFI